MITGTMLPPFLGDVTRCMYRAANSVAIQFTGHHVPFLFTLAQYLRPQFVDY